VFFSGCFGLWVAHIPIANMIDPQIKIATSGTYSLGIAFSQFIQRVTNEIPVPR